jgi:hypothetical protein
VFDKDDSYLGDTNKDLEIQTAKIFQMHKLIGGDSSSSGKVGDSNSSMTQMMINAGTKLCLSDIKSIS